MDAIVHATPTSTTASRIRPHLPFVVVGVVVALVGLLESWLTYGYTYGPPFVFIGPLIALAFGAAVAISRIQPGVALAIVWVVGALQLAGSVQVMFVQLAVVVIAFACARWGSLPIQWISGLSIPFAVLLIGVTEGRPFGLIVDLLGFNGIIDVAVGIGLPWRVLVGLAALAVLGLPWLVGFALRASDRVRTSEAPPPRPARRSPASPSKRSRRPRSRAWRRSARSSPSTCTTWSGTRSP